MAGNANSGGQNRKPTQMKVLEGTFRKDRANPNEPTPKPVKIAPAPTITLNAHGMKEWERTTRFLIETGVLAETDISALSALCYEFGEFVQCGIDIKEVKEIDSDLAGLAIDECTVEQRIELLRIKYATGKNLEKLRKEHLEAYGKLAQQFGLTPASRAKVSTTNKPKTDELEDL
jgi:P27 family predicted phage terminase small subunit